MPHDRVSRPTIRPRTPRGSPEQSLNGTRPTAVPDEAAIRRELARLREAARPVRRRPSPTGRPREIRVVRYPPEDERFERDVAGVLGECRERGIRGQALQEFLRARLRPLWPDVVVRQQDPLARGHADDPTTYYVLRDGTISPESH